MKAKISKLIQRSMGTIAKYAVGVVSRYCLLSDCSDCAIYDTCERIKHGFDEPHHWSGPWPKRRDQP